MSSLVDKVFYVKGIQGFMKKAGIVKYANEESAAIDAEAVAQALEEQGSELPLDAAVPDQEVADIANTLQDLAEEEEASREEEGEEGEEEFSEEELLDEIEEEEVKELMEEALDEEEAIEAEELAKTLGTEGELPPIEDMTPKEAAMSTKMASVLVEVKRGKLYANKLATALRKVAEGAVTTNEPSQVLSVSNTNYSRTNLDANAAGTGSTTLNTAKGAIGAQENLEHKLVLPKEQEAPEAQNMEGKDIAKKDYTAPGKGGTELKTEKGEIGKEEKADAKLARLAMESLLARIVR